MTQKGSIVIPFLIVLATTIFGIGAFYFLNLPKAKSTSFISPKSTQVTEEKYTNSALGFEFNYSKGLIAKEDSEQDFDKRGNGDFRKNFKGYVTYEPGKVLGIVAVLDKKASYETNPLTLWIFDNPENLSIDTWYKNYWYYPFVWGDYTYTGKFELAPKTEATVSGQVAKSGMIDYQPGKPKFVYVAKNKKMYLFRIIGEEGDKTFSTFKFN